MPRLEDFERIRDVLDMNSVPTNNRFVWTSDDVETYPYEPEVGGWHIPPIERTTPPSRQEEPNMPRTLRDYGIGRYTPEGDSPNILHYNFGVGIELEVEGDPSSERFPRSFEMTGDDSLRNGGVEIRHRKPLAGSQLETSVERLCNWLDGSGYSLSERCSTHIHLDVTDMTPSQLVNLLCLSVMLEPALFRVFANTRTVNMFCMSTDMGTTNYDNMVDLLHNPENFRGLNYSKYAAIGLYRLLDLGTVEYRMFNAIINKEDYFRILNFLFALKNEAMQMETPRSLIDMKLSMEAEQLFTHYFPETAYSPEFDGLLERGIQVLNDIIVTADTLSTVRDESRKYESLIEAARMQLEQVQRGI